MENLGEVLHSFSRHFYAGKFLLFEKLLLESVFTKEILILLFSVY